MNRIKQRVVTEWGHFQLLPRDTQRFFAAAIAYNFFDSIVFTFAYAYMFSHSGKKLLFMGQDFGQDEEWNEAKELSWELLEDPLHMGMQTYMKKMLEIYRKYACLYEIDNSWDGFEWMDADDTKNSIYSYVRKAENGKNNILVILNMTPMERKDYKIAVPNAGKYKLLLNSSDTQFGGTGYPVPKEVNSQKEVCHGKDYSISVDLAPYAALFFVF